tara:strand:- start:39 stop:749 length:711 start_codon:yes stop_codon:yes gene_type:complete
MTTDQLNNTSVEELALKAEDAIRDGVKTGDSVSLGDGMSGTIEVLDAGHSWVWDIRNGDRSKVNNNMLRTQLDKRDPDTNLRVFTTNPNHPGMPKPTVGQYKCILHKDERTTEHDRMGFVVCKKSNLISPSEVENHASRRHQNEWRQIKEAEARVRNERNERIQELQLERLLAQTQSEPAPVPAPAPVEVVADAETSMQSPEEFRTCPDCDEWTNDNPKIASRRMSFRHHTKKAHE